MLISSEDNSIPQSYTFIRGVCRNSEQKIEDGDCELINNKSKFTDCADYCSNNNSCKAFWFSEGYKCFETY